MIKLNDQKEPTLNLQTQDQENSETNIKVNYFKKIVEPSEEELKKHKEYLKNNLKKNYFN